MSRLPAIVSDIDGVVIRGQTPVQGAKESLERVLAGLDIHGQKKELPFMFLTNGGHYTEQQKADKMNASIGIDKDLELTADQIVQCHTVLKDKSIQGRFGDKFVLVDGIAADDVKIAESYGFKKVVTVLELLTLYPTAGPAGLYDFFMSDKMFQNVHKGLLARYGMTADELKNQLKFAAIFVLQGTFKALTFA